MTLLGSIHGRVVHARRVTVLADHIERLLPPGAVLLDVGCGDGLLTERLGALRTDLRVRGLDIKVRPNVRVPVQQFDGRHIPLADRSCDVVLLVDVLHHADDPMVLLQEAARVAGSLVIVKDHIQSSLRDRLTLRLMDWVGNAPHDVDIPANYWTTEQWAHAFEKVRLVVSSMHTSLGLYPRPARWLFERKLHFIAALQRDCPSRLAPHAQAS